MSPTGSNRLFVIALAVTCVLFATPPKIVAATDPDVPAARNAPEPHNVAEQMKLAQDYLDGRGVEQDVKKAAYWYEKAAGAGDPFAQFETGYFYETGMGVDKNPERAAHWYQLAASSGLPMAEVDLAVSYVWGTGVARDEASAFRLMSAAAAQGDGLAACYLGDFYAFGIGTPQDRSKAEKWYRNGASLHNPIAEFDLARLLIDAASRRGAADGQGAAGGRDLAAAAKLLRDSAAAGYVPAMHELGLLLIRNPNLALTAGEAVALLNDAADAGNWRSSVLLGVLERDGKGVPVDSERAYYHFRIATLQGGKPASKLIDHDLALLSAQLGRGRVEAIDLEANDWFKKHGASLMFVRDDDKSHRQFAVMSADSGHVAEMLTFPVR